MSSILCPEFCVHPRIPALSAICMEPPFLFRNTQYICPVRYSGEGCRRCFPYAEKLLKIHAFTADLIRVRSANCILIQGPGRDSGRGMVRSQYVLKFTVESYAGNLCDISTQKIHTPRQIPPAPHFISLSICKRLLYVSRCTVPYHSTPTAKIVSK